MRNQAGIMTMARTSAKSLRNHSESIRHQTSIGNQSEMNSKPIRRPRGIKEMANTSKKSTRNHAATASNQQGTNQKSTRNQAGVDQVSDSNQP